MDGGRVTAKSSSSALLLRAQLEDPRRRPRVGARPATPTPELLSQNLHLTRCPEPGRSLNPAEWGRAGGGAQMGTQGQLIWIGTEQWPSSSPDCDLDQLCGCGQLWNPSGP